MHCWSGKLIQLALERNNIKGFCSTFHVHEKYSYFQNVEKHIAIEVEDDNPLSLKKYSVELKKRRKSLERSGWFVIRVSCDSLFWRTKLTLEKLVNLVQNPQEKLVEL